MAICLGITRDPEMPSLPVAPLLVVETVGFGVVNGEPTLSLYFDLVVGNRLGAEKMYLFHRGNFKEGMLNVCPFMPRAENGEIPAYARRIYAPQLLRFGIDTVKFWQRGRNYDDSSSWLDVHLPEITDKKMDSSEARDNHLGWRVVDGYESQQPTPAPFTRIEITLPEAKRYIAFRLQGTLTTKAAQLLLKGKRADHDAELDIKDFQIYGPGFVKNDILNLDLYRIRQEEGYQHHHATYDQGIDLHHICPANYDLILPKSALYAINTSAGRANEVDRVPPPSDCDVDWLTSRLPNFGVTIDLNGEALILPAL